MQFSDGLFRRAKVCGPFLRRNTLRANGRPALESVFGTGKWKSSSPLHNRRTRTSDVDITQKGWCDVLCHQQTGTSPLERVKIQIYNFPPSVDDDSRRVVDQRNRSMKSKKVFIDLPPVEGMQVQCVGPCQTSFFYLERAGFFFWLIELLPKAAYATVDNL